MKGQGEEDISGERVPVSPQVVPLTQDNRGCPWWQEGKGVAGVVQGLPDPSARPQGPPVMGLLGGACLSGTPLYQGPDPKMALARDGPGIGAAE